MKYGNYTWLIFAILLLLVGIPVAAQTTNVAAIYSFVTMTTVGYGDIAPLSPVARLLAYLQAIFGQLYIAILVAGLVSAHISDRDRAGQSGGN